MAILIIIIHHCATLQPDPQMVSWVTRLTAAGWCGVTMFFVLSGFLITRILLDTRDDTHFFRTFYIRRVLRIFPLYYAFITFWFALRWATFSNGIDSGGWMYYLYLANFKNAHDGIFGPPPISPVWSLAIEEQFYLLWPTVVWVASERALMLICGSLILIAPIFRAWLVARGAGWVAVYALTPSHLDALAAGGAIALLVRHPVRLRRAAIPARIAIIIFLSILLTQMYRGAPMFADQTRKMAVALSCFAGLFAALLIVILSNPIGWLDRVLRFPPLRTIGKYSYAMYLFHVLIGFALISFHVSTATLPFMPHLVFTAILLLTSFCAAFISWHAYEKHFLWLKGFFQYHKGDDHPDAVDRAVESSIHQLTGESAVGKMPS